MKRWMTLLAVSVVLSACGKREEVTVDGTRQQTMRDENLKPTADDDARFANSMPQMPGNMMAGGAPAASPVVAGSVPDGWKEAPASMFRLLNYTFGEAGEVYVSASRGGVLENVNRWLGQFDKPALTSLDGLETTQSAGYEGVWVAADGRFGGAMGAEAKDDWSLRGVVLEKNGEILTVKMMGPAAAVAAEETNLRQFLADLKPAS
ncbi:hypothetical protein [Haloferula sargassicola]|uniref:Lipoprotein n=1 Tax=Haloferula sargassicola TaxID=490096 RepID=A0ABP9UWC5_9BACT